MRAIGLIGSMFQVRDIYKASSDLLDIVLERLSIHDPIYALESLQDDIANGKILGKRRKPFFNSYPATGEADIYPNFLAICRGMELFAEMMEGVNDWSKQADREQPLSVMKNVCVFTDKWEWDAFEAYDQPFRFLSLNRNFWFTFFLVTKHGITEIPFLPLELFSYSRQTGKG